MKNRNYFLIFIFACCSGVVCTAEGQNKNRHYVKNRIMTTEDGNSFREKVLYYDNFGKHTETVQVGASPQGKDLHFTFGYDILDRPVSESLRKSKLLRGCILLFRMCLRKLLFESDS